MLKQAALFLLLGATYNPDSVIIAPQPAPPPVVEATPFYPAPDAILLRGSVEQANQNLVIGTLASGVVSRTFVKTGDKVRKGQQLFQLDDRELQGQLKVLEANLQVARANLDRISDRLTQLRNPRDPRFINRDEIKARESDLSIAEANIKSVEAQIKQIKVMIDLLTVKAPREGVILQNDIQPGIFVQAGAEGPAMILGDLTKLLLRVDIEEQNAPENLSELTAVATPLDKNAPAIPLKFVRIEPRIFTKRQQDGKEEKVRVLQAVYSFDAPKDFPIYIGQRLQVYLQH